MDDVGEDDTAAAEEADGLETDAVEDEKRGRETKEVRKREYKQA